MNPYIDAIRNCILVETVAAYQDFHFHIAITDNGNLTIDYRGNWEPMQTHDDNHIPYLTIEHDGNTFYVSHYQWGNGKKYKTLKGAAKYVNDELKGTCNRRREAKVKQDAEREFKEGSIGMLQNFHRLLSHKGIESNLCLTTNRYPYDHLSIEAERVNTRIDISVTSGYQLEMVFAYPRITTNPETVLDILSVLSKEKTA